MSERQAKNKGPSDWKQISEMTIPTAMNLYLTPKAITTGVTESKAPKMGDVILLYYIWRGTGH